MDTNEDWYLEASIGSESPAPPRVQVSASRATTDEFVGDEAWETFLEIQQSFAQDLQWETLNLIIREHRQQTAQSSRDCSSALKLNIWL